MSGSGEVEFVLRMPVPFQSTRNVGSLTAISPSSALVDAGWIISQLFEPLSWMAESTSELRCHFWPVPWIETGERSESRNHRAEKREPGGMPCEGQLILRCSEGRAEDELADDELAGGTCTASTVRSEGDGGGVDDGAADE